MTGAALLVAKILTALSIYGICDVAKAWLGC